MIPFLLAEQGYFVETPPNLGFTLRNHFPRAAHRILRCDTLPQRDEHTEFASTQTPDWQQIPNTVGPTACYLPHIASCGLEEAEIFAGKDGKCAHLAGAVSV